MGKLWIKNGWTWTGGDRPRVLAGGVLCNGPKIEAVGPDRRLSPRAKGARVIDAGGALVAPGFINAHMHLYSTLARGMELKDVPPESFVQILERLWWRLDQALVLQDLGPSAEAVLLDALGAGVTTVIDHHSSPNCIDGSLDVLAESAARVGVRLSTCYEVSDRDGKERAKAGIAENLRFGKAVRGHPLLAGMFGLHASFSLADETLDVCAEAGREAGLPFHVHVAEAESDLRDARRRGYSGALARLYQRGVIGAGSIAAHCIHTTPGEWALLSEAGAVAVHNPQSNMNNAVGAAAAREMIAAGVAVGIGTDGMEADVREEIRAAFLLDHHRSGDPRGMWAEVASLLKTNQRLASSLFGVKLGELSQGAAADVVVYDYFPPTAFTPDNFAGHLLFGFYHAPARTVVVAGKVRVENGAHLSLDPAAVAARARERARKLWRRL